MAFRLSDLPIEESEGELSDSDSENVKLSPLPCPVCSTCLVGENMKGELVMEEILRPHYHEVGQRCPASPSDGEDSDEE